MRRLLLSIFACLPLLALAAAPAFTIVPTVVVYPPYSSGDAIDRESTSRIATLLATEIAKDGTVKMLTPKPGVERQNFLADARSIGADYYVTGFVTPIGDAASLIAQVVSTQSGSVVYSASAQLATFSELVGPADQLRDGILERSNRGLAAIQAPEQPAPPAPQPTAGGADVNVSTLLAHRKRGTPVLAPGATVAILAVEGSAGADQRAAVAQALAAALGHDGHHAIVVADGTPAGTVCSANNATALVGAWLDTPAASDAHAKATLRFVGFDCAGHVAFDRSFSAGLDTLSENAVTAYVNAR